MKNRTIALYFAASIPVLCASVIFQIGSASAAAMNDYCMTPPFIAQSVPPMVMFDVGRDHKLYLPAYNDGVDLDNDGKIDNSYNHSIEYYGYFNPYKCYTHSGGSSNNDYFTPVATNTDRFCNTGQWSGNILNWLTMSRMDIVRKVMYGGQRSQESPQVLLNRAYIPQDAHSWGKEYTGKLCSNGTTYNNMCVADADCATGYTCQDKSINLVGLAAPTAGNPCSAAPGYATKSSDSGYHKLLVVRYPNTNGTSDTDHDSLLTGFDTTQFYTGFTPTFVNDFNDTILDPTQNHGDNYAQIVVAQFSTGNKCNSNCSDKNQGGDWTFAIDGDDGVELEIRKTSDGQILNAKDGSSQLGWYGGHSASGGQTHSKTWTLANSTKYLIIVRHTEGGGQDGVRLWYQTPVSSGWHIFGQSSIMDVFAPQITTSGASTNTCALRNDDFLETGIPSTTTLMTGQGYHLFCNTTLSSGVPTSAAATQTTLLRMITNSTHRIWQWSLKERPVCDDLFEDNTSATTNRTDYTVQVEVCKSGVGTLTEKNVFERCRNYGGTYNAASDTFSGGTWMPIGLFQKYGEYNPNDPSGITRVCSKTMGKACNTDGDCGTGEGLCFDKSPMYFGATTTTYTKNTSGGVLRKNPGPVSDEVNMNNGTQQTSENERGNLIHSLDRMVVIDYDYGSHAYSDCGWIGDRPINEGECKMWGNPIAEMMYENLRYFAGKGAPTAAFNYSTSADSGVNLSKPSWGYTKGSTTYQPFDIYPSCAQPFILMLSDVNTSYDADQIPGSSYGSFIEDNLSPQLNLGATQASGKSLLNSLMDTISTTEVIGGKNWFIGESSGTTDFICSSKSAADLKSLRGICPEEPTKKGSYYAAALAYYGKNPDQFAKVTGHSPVSTFVVALSSPYTDIKIRAGSNLVGIVPVGKSVGGCIVNKCLGYSGCTYTTDASGRFQLSGCPSDSYCPTNGLVGMYINDVKYNSNNEIIYLQFRQNFEDMEQGADYDMDAIGTYEICTQAAATAGYGTCANYTLGANDLEVYVTSSYAAGCVDQVLGYVISGTTADGTYLVVRDKDSGSGSPIQNLPLESKLTFTSSSTPSANNLKNPLWFAAKWGGYTGSGVPDSTTKWDKNNDGDPDNYFPVNNPLQLDKQLENALLAILARTSSGTAASIVNNSGESGTNILQALYYPLKEFSGTQVSWIGELQNMWFYLDPKITKSAIREDTVSDKILDLNQDLISEITFDAAQSKTVVNRKNNDGTSAGQIELDDLTPLWRAGQLLQNRNLSTDPRTIKTSINGSALIDFNTSNNSTLQTYLQAASLTESSKIINYVIGYDTPSDLNIRNRTVTYKGNTGPWRLGDIISSTPKIQGSAPIQGYDLDYKDLTYKKFWDAVDYKKHNMVYASSNDGMLHAFNLGATTRLIPTSSQAKVAKILPDTSPPLGKEEWAYIPKNALPYLRYQLQPDYSHLFTVDGKIRLIDMSINVPASSLNGDSDAPCSSATYWNCLRKTTLTTSGSVCSNDFTRACVTDAGCDSPGKCSMPNTQINASETSWRTVLLAGMGLGGASRSSNGSCTTSTPSIPSALPDCVKAPITSPTGYENVGLSSYFALDVTSPSSPSLMWEFTAPGLGYTLSQPAIVRINGKKGGGGTTAIDPDTSKNGRWFAIFASGPTGPINTTSHQFYGKSDQNLKLFIVDLKTGVLERTIDTGISNAFAGLFGLNATVDTDAFNPHDQGYKDSSNVVLDPKGYYSTDVLYVGYTNFDTVNSKWDGGVGRLVTKEDTDPAKWEWSKVIKNIGPVTTAVTTLQDLKSKKLWLYFGAGRYFYKDATGIDDPDDRRYLYGIAEPCYPRGSGMTAINDLDVTCTAEFNPATLVDKSDEASSTANNGWKIKLWPSWSRYKAERLLTNPTALYTGNVSFTTFQPTADICGFGGQSFTWVVDGMSGGMAAASSLIGQQIFIQLTTGAFAKINFSTDMLARMGRRTSTNDGNTPLSPGETLSNQGSEDHQDDGFTGGTGNDENKILKPPKGIPRILHYKER